MAEFIEVMKHKERMCKSILSCSDCDLSCDNNGEACGCRPFFFKHPQEAEEIIMKWAKENPVKTNADVFRETFGYEVSKHPHNCSGINCPEEQYYNCRGCTLDGFWNKEYKEPKGDK